MASAILAYALILLAVAAMAASLLLIPLGLPGTWMMLAVLTVAALAGEVGWGLLVGLGALAAVAEVAEFLLLKGLTSGAGGSSRAFWGAVIGGLVGVMVGLPVPVVGSLLAGLAGTFLGAALGAWSEDRRLGVAARLGWRTLLARVLAAALKTGAGIVILASGTAALLAR